MSRQLQLLLVLACSAVLFSLSNQHRSRAYAQEKDDLKVQVQKLKQQLEKKELLLNVVQTEKKMLQKLLEALQKESQKLQKDFAANNAQIAAQLKQLTAENLNAAQLLKKREAQLNEFEKRLNALQAQLTEAINEKKLLTERNQQLLKRLRELELWKAKHRGKEAVPKNSKTSKKSVSNPPPVSVKGVIEKVDAQDDTFVLISLGSDHGIKVNHTLHVFRRNPQPTYLGQIRILEVTAEKSVARLTPQTASAKIKLKVGDQVASQLSP